MLFERFYALDADQSAKARARRGPGQERGRDAAVDRAFKEVEKIAPYPPALKLKLIVTQRLEE